MKHLLTQTKTWQTLFVFAILLNLIVFEFLIYTLPILMLIGGTASVFALKEKNIYIPLINLALIIGLAALYFILL